MEETASVFSSYVSLRFPPGDQSWCCISSCEIPWDWSAETWRWLQCYNEQINMYKVGRFNSRGQFLGHLYLENVVKLALSLFYASNSWVQPEEENDEYWLEVQKKPQLLLSVQTKPGWSTVLIAEWCNPWLSFWANNRQCVSDSVCVAAECGFSTRRKGPYVHRDSPPCWFNTESLPRERVQTGTTKSPYTKVSLYFISLYTDAFWYSTW